MRTRPNLVYPRDSHAYRHGDAYLKTTSTLRGSRKAYPSGGLFMVSHASPFGPTSETMVRGHRCVRGDGLAARDPAKELSWKTSKSLSW